MVFIFNKAQALGRHFSGVFRRDRPLVAALALGLAGLALRLMAVPEQLGDVDAVNLARGLLHYDLFAQAPHPPGYPVVIAGARVAAALGVAQESWALALPGIVLWLPAGTLGFVGLRRLVGSWPALGAVAGASLAPGVVLASAWPGSEGIGLALLAAAVGWAGLGSKRASLASAAALGLCLGARLSWWPVVLAGLIGLAWYRRDHLVASSLGACAGVAAWLVPLLVMFDPLRLWRLAISFGHGHVASWGGTALEASSSGIGERLAQAGGGFWRAGLGAAWPALNDAAPGEASSAGWVLGAVAALAAARLLVTRTSVPWAAALALLALPYVVWLIGFQNLEKPRHLVPLLPVMGLVVAAGVARWRQRSILAVAGLAALLAIAAPRAWQQGTRPTPGVALMQWLTTHHAPDGLLVFAGQEARVLEHYAPMYRVLRPADGRVMQREAERASALGVRVLITSTAPGFPSVKNRTRPITTFQFPHSVRPHDSHIVLTRYTPPSSRLAWRSDSP